MYVVVFDNAYRLVSVICGKGVVALRLKIYFKRRNNVPFVIEDLNVIHSLPNLR